MQKQKILVTGGCGYIGSHTVVELLDNNYDVVIVDNLINSNIQVLDRIKNICGCSPEFYQEDINNENAMDNIFSQHTFTAVIHFAALKAVGESVHSPLRYYENNISGSVVLFKTMTRYNVFRIIFSSSATVYGNSSISPLTEDCPLSPTSPYAWTKVITEQILRDMKHSQSKWSIGILRYFNPVGAHQSGLIGEDPNDTPNNLMPYITQVAIGKLPILNVFGDDYPTHDGTGIRDYIHVVDLARGHLHALSYLIQHTELLTVNLGTGVGYSVLDVIKTFSKASGCNIPYQIKPRRMGDVPIYLANPEKANKLLNWHAEYNLLQMCRDSWRWQCSHC